MSATMRIRVLDRSVTITKDGVSLHFTRGEWEGLVASEAPRWGTQAARQAVLDGRMGI